MGPRLRGRGGGPVRAAGQPGSRRGGCARAAHLRGRAAGQPLGLRRPERTCAALRRPRPPRLELLRAPPRRGADRRGRHGGGGGRARLPLHGERAGHAHRARPERAHPGRGCVASVVQGGRPAVRRAAAAGLPDAERAGGPGRAGLGRGARGGAAAGRPGGRSVRASGAARSLAGGGEAVDPRRPGAPERAAPLARAGDRRPAGGDRSPRRDRARGGPLRGGRRGDAAGRGAAPRHRPPRPPGGRGRRPARRAPLRVPRVRARAGRRGGADAVRHGRGALRALGPEARAEGRPGRGGARPGARVRRRSLRRRRVGARGAPPPLGPGGTRRHVRAAPAGRHLARVAPPGRGSRPRDGGRRPGAMVDVGNVWLAPRPKPAAPAGQGLPGSLAPPGPAESFPHFPSSFIPPRGDGSDARTMGEPPAR